MNVMRIRYLIGAKLQQSSIFTNAFHSYFLKAIEHLFLRVYRRYKPTRDVGRTLEKLVNHSPSVHILFSEIIPVELELNFKSGNL